MKSRFILISALLTLSMGIQAQESELRDYQGTHRLFWHGEPFLMLSGELHNSTSTTYEYLSQTMESLKAMHLNSVIVFDQTEPYRHEGSVRKDTCERGIHRA
jgi:hypothetical protein